MLIHPDIDKLIWKIVKIIQWKDKCVYRSIYVSSCPRLLCGEWSGRDCFLVPVFIYEIKPKDYLEIRFFSQGQKGILEETYEELGYNARIDYYERSKYVPKRIYLVYV